MDKNNILKDVKIEYDKWLENAKEEEIHEELLNLKGDVDELIDSFYTSLKFGTSGIRGILGAGTNRINIYVIRRVTQGLSNYLKTNYDNPSVVIAYDTRKNSKRFATESAKVLSGNGIKVHLYDKVAPVSLLSFSIRELKCTMGIMITASHNPKIYNGYKVYNNHGYQIVGHVASSILEEIEKLDYFTGILSSEKNIFHVETSVKEAFLNKVCSFCNSKTGDIKLNLVKTIYTPLNGAGSKYVKETFHRLGYENFQVVKVQENPDENFTTCQTPNPEKISTYNEAFKALDENSGDIIIATDPDCDRIGVALYYDGMKVLLTGNQLGILILDYLCHVRKPRANQIVLKSIVTSPLIESICDKYSLKVINTLTGFKYIGEIVTRLEAEGRLDDFYFGLEESNGYLIDGFIRDKDGVSGAMVALETAAYNKASGKNLVERLYEIYEEYGVCIDKTRNYFFEGFDGKLKMEKIMEEFRTNVNESLGGVKILKKIDYMNQDLLPKEQVIEFHFEGGDRFIIRPSGTEAKLKVYSFERENSTVIEEAIKEIIDETS